MKKAIVASTGNIETSRLNTLLQLWKQELNILEEMDNETYEELDNITGVHEVYQNLIENVQDLQLYLLSRK